MLNSLVCKCNCSKEHFKRKEIYYNYVMNIKIVILKGIITILCWKRLHRKYNTP